MTTTFAPQLVRPLRRRLLAWYRRHRRDLPWRAMNGRAVNPYHVLVSEAMLQQTQVATVIDYFHRFIAALPTIEALAAAPERQVLRLWQGLGYYRRARNLHAAAKAIVAQHQGRVPDSVEQLVLLAGIGRYTAGAIASIAYNKRAPILDGNVARVLARWFAIEDPVDAPATRRRLWALAAALPPARTAGDFNQAMMELGALVCVPRQPRCQACPVANLCEANARHLTAELPIKAKRRPAVAVEHHVLVIRRGERFLFQQRPHDGLWSNMWQFPTFERELAKPADLCAWAREHLGFAVAAPKRAATFKHQTTHRTITFVIWRTTTTHKVAKNADIGPADAALAWRTLVDLDDLPLPNPQRRIAAMIRDERLAKP